MCKLIYAIVIGSYIAAQTWTSLSDSQLYPLNPYRMFSSNWKDGIRFAFINYVDANEQSHKPWELVRTPFFQANRLAYNVFIKSKNKNEKEVFCQHLRSRSNSKQIQVIGSTKVFSRVKNNPVKTQKDYEELSYQCKI